MISCSGDAWTFAAMAIILLFGFVFNHYFTYYSQQYLCVRVCDVFGRAQVSGKIVSSG